MNEQNATLGLGGSGTLGDAGGAAVPREKMTFRQLMEAQAERQEGFRMESEVRQLAREAGMKPAEVDGLVLRARGVFRGVKGRLLPLGEDGRTVLQAKSGDRMLSVGEWTRAELVAAGFGPEAGVGGGSAAELPLRNPFKKKFWNLTEQMRLRRRDPEFAERLKAEAWLEG